MACIRRSVLCELTVTPASKMASNRWAGKLPQVTLATNQVSDMSRLTKYAGESLGP